MKEKKHLNNNGFSLMELIVCLAISGFVVVAAYSLVMVGTKSYDTNSKTTNLQQEVSFTNNLLRETILAGNQSRAYIWTSNDEKLIELHTDTSGGKIICYDKDAHAVYIYNESASWTCGDFNSDTNKREHLVTEYATDFKADFVATAADVSIPDWTSGSGGKIKNGIDCTNLIKIVITFEYKSKKDESNVVYQIRNKS